MLITTDYVEQNKVLHATGEYGIRGGKWADQIGTIAVNMKAVSVLDYGAGQQTLQKSLPHLNVHSYDPAIPEISARPLPAALVCCTDVLEHIEPECLTDVLDDIKNLAMRAVFLVVATRPAKKTLPDGRNAHLLQYPLAWWLPQLMGRWELRQVNSVPNEFVFFGKAL